MEDTSFICEEIAAPHAAGVHLYGVFDGHGGSGAARFAQSEMLTAGMWHSHLIVIEIVSMHNHPHCTSPLLHAASQSSSSQNSYTASLNILTRTPQKKDNSSQQKVHP